MTRLLNTQVLDPLDRVSETIFGLIMALTFTGAVSVAQGGGSAESALTVSAMLIAAIGCNIAWGIVDGFMYVIRTLVTRGREAAQVAAIRSAEAETARTLLRDALPGDTGAGVTEAHADQMIAWIRARPKPESSARLRRSDLREATAVIVLVVLSTFPPILPFVIFDELPVAMRVSNVVALAMFAVLGHALDRLMAHGPRFVIILPILGTVLTVLTIALGG